MARIFMIAMFADMFNDYEVDGRRLEVRYDRLGWWLAVSNTPNCHLLLFLNY